MLAPFVLAACDPAPAPPSAAAVADQDLCRMQGVVPVSPRLVVTPLLGEPRALDRAVCAACLAAQPGVWAAGDRDVVELHAGPLVLELPNDARSPLRASHALAGVALGRGAALADLGDGWLLWQAGRAPRVVTPPPLEPGDLVWGVGRDDAPLLLVRGELPASARLVPLEGPPPEQTPLRSLDGASLGYVERAERGAAVVSATGARVQLGDTRLILAAAMVSGVVVAGAPRETVVATPGAAVERVREPDLVLVDDDVVLVVEPRARRVRRAGAGGWTTVLQARPGENVAGMALADGALPVRLHAALAHGHLALVERVRAADCEVNDGVHLLDLSSGAWRTVVNDAHLRMHLAPVDDGFGWVEADMGRIGP